jgi:hypothetical protein
MQILCPELFLQNHHRQTPIQEGFLQVIVRHIPKATISHARHQVSHQKYLGEESTVANPRPLNLGKRCSLATGCCLDAY